MKHTSWPMLENPGGDSRKIAIKPADTEWLTTSACSPRGTVAGPEGVLTVIGADDGSNAVKVTLARELFVDFRRQVWKSVDVARLTD